MRRSFPPLLLPAMLVMPLCAVAQDQQRLEMPTIYSPINRSLSDLLNSGWQISAGNFTALVVGTVVTPALTVFIRQGNKNAFCVINPTPSPQTGAQVSVCFALN